ncbi:Oxygen-dependent coproporphyrinogen-III oxidase [Halotydeus destructor]|nr:Oxygen-dependent coproporphyrinogen-III oxidase [Halotydeus destructor]
MFGRKLICSLVAAGQRVRCQYVGSRWYSSKKNRLIGVSGGALLAVSGFGFLNHVTADEFMAESVTPLRKLQTSPGIRERFEIFLLQTQKAVCSEILRIEEEYEKLGLKVDLPEDSQRANFVIDRWVRAEGGGGISCVLEDGQVFERAGVNVSVVHGNLPPSAIQQMKARGHDFKLLPGQTGLPFFAAGVSSVVHPRNPHIPTVHFNYRYFEVIEQTNDPDVPKVTWWFGGGTDLTPYILHDDDAIHFHKTLKEACDKHDKTYYGHFKKWCDNYFVNTHRKGERRGVGGIFFDDMEELGREGTFKFVKSCAGAVIPCYFPLVRKNMNRGYDYADRQWQLLRRGRYVEFNLVHDRGTKFGLHTPEARIESILMSLPREAKWKYNYVPAAGSEEARLTEILKNPKEWV